MPLKPEKKFHDISAVDRASARALALLVIVVLAFAVRNEAAPASPKVTYATLAAGLAILLSTVMHVASKKIAESLRDTLLISGYSSTIVLLFFFVFFHHMLADTVLYQSIVQDIPMGGSLLPAGLSFLTAFGLLILKSYVWDKNSLDVSSLATAAGMTAFAAGIAVSVHYISNDLFSWLIQRIKIGALPVYLVG